MATKRSAGPFFVAFPNIREALANNTPIKTDARSCTILPNFVGYVFDSSLKEGVRV
jgi:ribosomal protein S19